MHRKLVSLSLITALGGSPAFAAEPAASPELQRGPLGFGIGAVAGALLAGPPGLVGGAIVGALFGRGEDLEAQRDTARIALAGRDQQLAEMHTEQVEALQLASRAAVPAVAQPDPLQEIARGVAQGVEINFYFRTGSATIEPQYQAQLRQLPAVLTSLPMLNLALSGHADRRGADQVNAQLSRLRVEQVAQQLIEAGVAAERIALDQYGEARPVSQPGDAAAYGFDRRVQLRFVVRESDHRSASVALAE